MSEHNDDRSVLINFLAGVGVGALVGAAAALILAPKSGDETREDLKHITEDIKLKASTVAKDLTESGDELIKKGKELVETTKDKIHDVIETGKSVVSKKIEIEDESSECKEATTEA